MSTQARHYMWVPIVVIDVCDKSMLLSFEVDQFETVEIATVLVVQVELDTYTNK